MNPFLALVVASFAIGATLVFAASYLLFGIAWTLLLAGLASIGVGVFLRRGLTSNG